MSLEIAITTLLSALLGAMVGGAVTYWIGCKQRTYELRRDAYLAFIELRIKGGYPSPQGWKLGHNPHFSRDLFLAKYKIDLIGSEKIKGIVNAMIGALYPDAPDIEEEYKPTSRIEDDDARWNTFTTKCDRELKPAIKMELEEWWPLERIYRSYKLKVKQGKFRMKGTSAKLIYTDRNGKEIKDKHWWQFWK